MNGLLSMIGMQTELDYLMGDFAACFGYTPLAIPKGSVPSDKQKCQPKEQHEFTIKGIKIMADSKKDDITEWRCRYECSNTSKLPLSFLRKKMLPMRLLES